APHATSLTPLPRSTTTPLFPYTTPFRSRSRTRFVSHHNPRRRSSQRSKSMRYTASSLSSTLCALRSAWHTPRSWNQCAQRAAERSEEHTSELQSHLNIVCRLLLEKNYKH